MKINQQSTRQLSTRLLIKYIKGELFFRIHLYCNRFIIRVDKFMPKDSLLDKEATLAGCKRCP